VYGGQIAKKAGVRAPYRVRGVDFESADEEAQPRSASPPIARTRRAQRFVKRPYLYGA